MVKDRLVELAYRTAWRVVRMAPEGLAKRAFRRLADWTTAKNGKGVRQLRANLRRVVGPEASHDEMEALLRDAVRSYCRYWMEAFRLPSYPREELLDRFCLDGHEVFDVHRAQGSGVIVAIPHSGNWDWAGAWVAAKGWPITTVAERLKPKGVYERFLDYRRGLGMTIVPHSGGDRPAQEVLAEALADGHIVPLVADRDLSANGVEVEFFGEPARMPAGPALLAIRTGAPLYTVVLRNDGPRRVYGKMEGPVEVPAEGDQAARVATVTQAVADAFAAGISAQPADWHMLQRLWTADLETSSPTAQE